MQRENDFIFGKSKMSFPNLSQTDNSIVISVPKNLALDCISFWEHILQQWWELKQLILAQIIEPWHVISNNVAFDKSSLRWACATSF